ncbi:hypothetical protein IQ268_28810 [Oculatella sp. LEGE 06141]|uniref:PIN domain-containing protein n=1 Tax=Oculatella sp. LEGE 06141 TaxID=1828648 RepID=UPI0018814AF9|nr:PIN domain-containing protein [Oculatella sp. LEGE 06141]MBE9182556.1 hypothetical protein [Oculatella sp. LEGE 06141]
MAALPPVLLILDVSALSAAPPQEWLEFSRVGSCVIPQVVYEEMRFLFDRTPDPDLERIAKAFNRLYPGNGWQISDLNAPHPELKSGTGQAMTKRARVSLAVGRCAYGMAQTVPNSLVIMVTQDRSLLQRFSQIQLPNLCGITGEALLQWCRSGQRPVNVSQKLQQFRAAVGAQSGATVVNQPYPSVMPSRATAKKPPRTTSTPIRSSVSLPGWFPDLISLLSAVVALAIAGMIIWALFSDSSLRQFLFRTGQPAQSSQ